jgi:sulfate transport system ATP-binding protein
VTNAISPITIVKRRAPFPQDGCATESNDQSRLVEADQRIQVADPKRPHTTLSLHGQRTRQMSIEIRNITKSFGNYTALDNVSLKVRDGELLALLGPSGSGKTTLLRIIAGLDVPDSDTDGQILFGGEDVARRAVAERQVGFVFQHYALFRHMSVFENIAFGLRVRPRHLRPSKQAIREKVEKLLELIQLGSLGNRYPSQLSGGQRQRVALARALAIEPKVLLLDEPFGALDAKVRQGLRTWLRRLHDELHVTSVLVTHDQEEALEVADRVVVMNQARIEQVGTPEEVFHRPSSEFVMDFLGHVNVFHGRVENGRAVLGGASIASPELGSGSQPATVYVRPHELEIHRQRQGDGAIPATVTRLNPIGAIARIGLSTENGDQIQVDLPFDRYVELELRTGESVFVSPKKTRVFLPEYVI